jgi:hypothetical protein
MHNTHAVLPCGVSPGGSPQERRSDKIITINDEIQPHYFQKHRAKEVILQGEAPPFIESGLTIQYLLQLVDDKGVLTLIGEVKK